MKRSWGSSVGTLANQTHSDKEALLISLAREVAMDINAIETILKTHQITAEEWRNISESHFFQNLLLEQSTIWQGALNTQERVKVKLMAAVEEATPAIFAMIHDPKEPANARVEAFKALQRGAGVGGVTQEGNAGDKVKIVINLGADREVTVVAEKPTTLIEGEVVEAA